MGMSCADGDQEVVLGDRQGDAGGVALLERVGADGGRGHLAGDDDHRDRVHVGVAQRRDDVGGGRAAGHHGDAGLAGGVGVALGHVAGALLVAHEDVADRRVDDRVVHREDGPAGQAEDDLDPFHLEGLDEGLASVELHGVPFGIRATYVQVCGWAVRALLQSARCRYRPRKLQRPPTWGGRERTRTVRTACAT